MDGYAFDTCIDAELLWGTGPLPRHASKARGVVLRTLPMLCRVFKARKSSLHLKVSAAPPAMSAPSAAAGERRCWRLLDRPFACLTGLKPPYVSGSAFLLDQPGAVPLPLQRPRAAPLGRQMHSYPRSAGKNATGLLKRTSYTGTTERKAEFFDFTLSIC